MWFIQSGGKGTSPMTRPATPKKAIRKGANSSPSRGKITVDFFVFKNSFSFWGLSFFIIKRTSEYEWRQNNQINILYARKKHVC